ncbi:MAG: hypothetical protein ACE5LU_22625 [Anaerolineae bacterium]
MGSRLRVWIVAIATAVLITALAPFAFGVSRGAQPSVLVVISPPSGLGLPVGQHVGVRYRFTGETPAILELAADGVTLVADGVQPGQQVTHAWTPAKPGPHQVLVRALGLDGTVLDSAGLVVIGLPVGSRVQVP